jgi:hypothetical protein
MMNDIAALGALLERFEKPLVDAQPDRFSEIDREMMITGCLILLAKVALAGASSGSGITNANPRPARQKPRKTPLLPFLFKSSKKALAPKTPKS